MAGLQFDREKVLAAMDAVAERTMRMDLTWDWPCGVAYYGICEAAQASGNDRYLSLVQERVDELMSLGLPPVTVNTCSMGHCCLTLFERTGEAKYREAAERLLRYLAHDAPRFGEGILQHTVSAKDDFPEQCWADTLFMAAFFLLRAGVLFSDEAMVDDALLQYGGHIRYLQDASSGLFYHGYDNRSQSHMSGFYWGRANAWAAYTMAQVDVRLPECYLYPKYMDVAGSLSEQLSALKLVQTENGLWRTILDDPDSYEEVSASDPQHQVHHPGGETDGEVQQLGDGGGDKAAEGGGDLLPVEGELLPDGAGDLVVLGQAGDPGARLPGQEPAGRQRVLSAAHGLPQLHGYDPAHQGRLPQGARSAERRWETQPGGRAVPETGGGPALRGAGCVPGHP